MRLLLTKLENITLTIITTYLLLSPLCLLLLVRLGDYIVTTSGVHLAQHDRGQFHYRHSVFSSQLKSKVDNILTKTTTLRVKSFIDMYLIRMVRSVETKRERDKRKKIG
jgi:hypothetical protein